MFLGEEQHPALLWALGGNCKTLDQQILQRLLGNKSDVSGSASSTAKAQSCGEVQENSKGQQGGIKWNDFQGKNQLESF